LFGDVGFRREVTFFSIEFRLRQIDHLDEITVANSTSILEVSWRLRNELIDQSGVQWEILASPWQEESGSGGMFVSPVSTDHLP
jgi:hypothetical protein